MEQVAACKASVPPLCGSTVGYSDLLVHLQDKASVKSTRMATGMGMGHMSWIDKQLATKTTTKQREIALPNVWAWLKTRGMEWNMR